MACPSDEVLRTVLSDGLDDPTLIEQVVHLVQCPDCRKRIVSWNERPRLEQILKAFADGTGGDQEPGPSGQNSHSEPEAKTNVYSSKSNRRVGQYELLRSIGKGGGGEVFEAMHVRLRRRMAVKVLSTKDAGDEAIRQRFFREMESIGQLNHPHIVHAHDAGEADGTLYLAMELVEGENVESLARRVGPLPVADACEIIRQAALGLQHVHENHLVHRDLKPSNLLMSAAGVKIADLGLALLHRGNSTDERLTGHHMIVGTADYIAPEQSEESHDVDIRADIYSLGCTLFRLLAGRPPYALPEYTTPVKKMWAHQSNPIPDIRKSRTDVPTDLAAILRKLMAKNPNDRFAEPRELAEALLPFTHASDVPSLILPGLVGLPTGERSATARDATDPLKITSQATRPTMVQPQTEQVRRPRMAVITSAVCAIGLLGLLGWFEFQQRRQPVVEPGPRTNIVLPVAPTIPETPPADKSLVENRVVVEPKLVEPQPAQVVAALGPIKTRWKKEFGRLPAELLWGRPMDIGSAEIVENVGSLVVQARKSIRLVQLGEIKDNEPGMALTFKVNHQSRGGEYGVFFGFRKDDNDIPEFIEFQLIAVVHLSMTEAGENIIVRRSLERFSLQTGHSESKRNHHVRMQLPKGEDSLPFEIRIKENWITDVKVGGRHCDELCSPEQNSHFLQMDYEGPFGFFVEDTSVWFNNPRFERLRP